MSQSPMSSRSIYDLKNINKNVGKYRGTSSISLYHDRNLIKLYLYGDETGFKPISKNVKTIDFGERYKKLYPKAKYYEMNSRYGNGITVPVDINHIIKNSFINKKPIKISLSATADNPVFPKDNISGHQIQTDFTDVPTLITQDL